MTDYRKILMLRSMGCSQREMERNKIASRETSKAVFETADRLGICWPLDDDITNADLERLLFPNKYKNACLYVEPDYQYIHRELAKPGVTLTYCGRNTAASVTRPERHFCGITPTRKPALI